MDNYHTTVLLNEAVDYLNVKPDSWYIDATLGGGGHTSEIVRRGGKVLAIDADEDAIEHARSKFQISNFKFQIGNYVIITRGNFRDVDKIVTEQGIQKISGILFDLGVSGHQLSEPTRGFSFQNTGPLDMRMDADLQVKAADLVNILSKKELYELFNKFGQEPFSYAIANCIVRARRIKPIETTEELEQIVKTVYRGKKMEMNPSTRVFQALRIVINDELNSLEQALPKSLSILGEKGRIVVIAFHSLEDRIVKKTFEQFEDKGFGTIITKKPLVPSEDEVQKNKKSRSAKLRVFEKN